MAANNQSLDKLLNKVKDESGMSDAEEILRLQATRQLKNEHKKVAQMTDLEKLLYAQMEQQSIEEYEQDFVSDKPLTYGGEHISFYSPLASTILDAFFTDGEN